ncbi:MAG: tRNA 2-thiouridine(34) synthase MnmA [Armatimonadetes bacterium]|nr:tRNA 2-thiouridine(34) synthase MnmA [Armatimonadota bacterium]
MRLQPPTQKPYNIETHSNKNIAVMMSGGVDSSVTALLLKQEGWNVVGVTMKIPYAQGCDLKRSCCGVQAAYVCSDLEIPHYFLDVQEVFIKKVIEPFREWYEQGKTPSPCVDCNTEIKFSHAWDCIIEQLGVDHIATGHYAQVIIDGPNAYLARAVDLTKDQTYFLYGIKRERLPRLRLPLGGLTKTEVRAIARKSRLPVASRPESMELCFSGEGDYREALGDRGGIPGAILNPDGEVIGEHTGIANYTIGQRKGMGIAARDPLFVTRIDPQANTITAADRSHLFTDTVHAENMNILIPELTQPGTIAYGKIRSQGEPDPCEITASDKSTITVRFANPIFAPTPGQRLVIYDAKSHVIAGGIIEL